MKSPRLRLPIEGMDLRVFPDAPSLSRAAAGEFVSCATEAIQRRGRFDVALAGGSTPRSVYSLLAARHSNDLEWDKVHLFFGDERHVPPDDAGSNFRMVRESLLAAPAIRATVHRIEAERDAATAADRYEATLRRHFQVSPPAQPRFDLVLLGMGADGHTASLFPGTSALAEMSRAVVANAVPQLNTDRITLTFPVLNNAARVIFLVAGGDKAAMLRCALRGDPAGAHYPVQAVRPASGTLTWMIDAAAAAGLD